MDRTGFSLIELLVAMGIISILSAIAIPQFNSVRERALVSTMKGDLHNLRLAQEVYYRQPDNDYASSLAELGDQFTASPDVVVTITDAGVDHYSASASHPGTSQTCSYTTEENLIVCVAGGSGKGAGK